MGLIESVLESLGCAKKREKAGDDDEPIGTARMPAGDAPAPAPPAAEVPAAPISPEAVTASMISAAASDRASTGAAAKAGQPVRAAPNSTIQLSARKPGAEAPQAPLSFIPVEKVAPAVVAPRAAGTSSARPAPLKQPSASNLKPAQSAGLVKALGEPKEKDASLGEPKEKASSRPASASAKSGDQVPHLIEPTNPGPHGSHAHQPWAPCDPRAGV